MGIVVAIIVGLVIDMIPRLDNNNYSPKYTEIEDTLKAACDNYRIPGMAVEVVDAEGVLFSGTYGECKSLTHRLSPVHSASRLLRHAS